MFPVQGQTICQHFGYKVKIVQLSGVHFGEPVQFNRKNGFSSFVINQLN